MREGQEAPQQPSMESGETQSNQAENQNLSLRERTSNFFLNRIARLRYFGTVAGASAGLGLAALSGNVYPGIGLTVFGVVIDMFKNKQADLAEGRIDALGRKINRDR